MNNTVLATGNDFNVLAVPPTEDRDPDWQPSITWMNMAGDVTITWDAKNKEQILDYARKKMEEGYSFYVIKPKKLFGITRDARHKVTEKNFDKVADGSKAIVIPDAALNDLIKAGVANLKDANRQSGNREFETGRRVKKAEELLDNDTLAMKPIVGG